MRSAVNETRQILREYTEAVISGDRETARLMGLNSTDQRCIEILVTEPEAEITPRVIADRLNLTTGSVTTMLDRLERAGYALRVPHETDRRKTIVKATLEAQAAAWSLIRPLIDESYTLAARYSLDELAVINRFMGEVAEMQNKHVERLRAQESPS